MERDWSTVAFDAREAQPARVRKFAGQSSVVIALRLMLKQARRRRCRAAPNVLIEELVQMRKNIASATGMNHPDLARSTKRLLVTNQALLARAGAGDFRPSPDIQVR